MKILKIIHGYPELYNAGSEIYSQSLCQELALQGHEVVVFSRQENAYKQEYSLDWRYDSNCPRIKLCLINMAHSRDGYRHSSVDQAFEDLLEIFHPDIIHIGHLNHLSTSLVTSASEKKIPLVFTLHDFWLMCPRGQFLQATNSKTENLYPVCESQEDRKCALNCYARYFSSQDDVEDIDYWTRWVTKRMKHIREITSRIDVFIAPSKYLMNRFVTGFSINPSKILYLDYGFHRERLVGRERNKSNSFTFGYIGTHKQAKGIFHLLQAFKHIASKATLKIWGAPLQPFTKSLQAYIASLDLEIQSKIHWIGDYRNPKIVEDVFNQVDAIVVPSIWGENSPLVIHEALEAGVPVITADYGGMKEYIHHEINGLLFKHRDHESLKEQMVRFVENPQFAESLSKTGYLQSEDGRIPCIREHVTQISQLYVDLIKKRKENEYTESRPLAHHI